MKAIERIKRYGLKTYIKTCLHKEPTPVLIAKYKEKYGNKIPVERPVRYQQTFWNITFRDESSGAIEEIKYIPSRAHQLPDDDRDLEEAINNGQYKLGGSNWKAIEWEKVGRRYIYHEELPERKPKRQPERKPERKPEKKEVIPAAQIAEIAKGLKMAGLSPEEIGRAIREIVK